MSNPHANPTRANTRRHEIIAEKIVAAGKWLDEPLLPDGKVTRRFVLAFSYQTINQYAPEYAALLSIHPRTARRYLDVAYQQDQEKTK